MENFKIGKCFYFPAMHAGHGLCHSIYTTEPKRQITSNLLIALPSEELGGPPGTIASRTYLPKLPIHQIKARPTHDTQTFIRVELRQSHLIIDWRKRYICIQVAHEIVLEVCKLLIRNFERPSLRPIVPFSIGSSTQEENEVVCVNILIHNLVGTIRRTITNDHPFRRQNGLGDNRAYRLFDVRFLISSSCEEDIRFHDVMIVSLPVTSP